MRVAPGDADDNSRTVWHEPRIWKLPRLYVRVEAQQPARVVAQNRSLILSPILKRAQGGGPCCVKQNYGCVWISWRGQGEQPTELRLDLFPVAICNRSVSVKARYFVLLLGWAAGLSAACKALLLVGQDQARPGSSKQAKHAYIKVEIEARQLARTYMASPLYQGTWSFSSFLLLLLRFFIFIFLNYAYIYLN